MQDSNHSNLWNEVLEEGGNKYSISSKISLELDIACDEDVDTIKDNFDQAFFMLSQTVIGRHLLTKAKEHGVTIIVGNKDSFSDKEEHINAYITGLEIHMRAEQNPAHIAITLAHELIHLQQNEYQKNIEYLSDLRLDQAIILEWATEAEAYAASAQFALELANPPKDAPSNIWHSDIAMEELKHIDSVSYEIASLMHGSNIYDGQHMAIQFMMFYSNLSAREVYAEHMLEHFNKVRGLGNDLLDILSYKKKLDKKSIKGEFNYLGKAYLKEHIPELDIFSEEYYSAMPTAVKKKVIEFYDDLPLLTHFFQKRAVKKLPTYNQEDINSRIKVYKQGRKAGK